MLQTVYLENGSNGQFYSMYILTQSILKKVLFIYLFRLPWVFVVSRGLTLPAMHGLLLAVASPDVAHGLWCMAHGNFPDQILNPCALH